METVTGVVLATVFQLPFILALGLPFTIGAWVASRVLRDKWPKNLRCWLVGSIMLVGNVPILGSHASMMPAIYFLFLVSGGWQEAFAVLVLSQLIWFGIWWFSLRLFLPDERE